ncbi:MAG: adenosylcobinamide-GDP ribazoletransferase [Burkholderiales bacterium]|nr:adenosylcobinamide-GDP ribazoletransferase [Anaerolineae bacterium]
MLTDLRGAFAFLTVIPVGSPHVERPGRAFTYFPLVGLVIGVIVSFIATRTLFAPEVSAFLALAAWVILTGGLHLDGFGDSCDGLFSTTTPERRLEIMKDPRAGSWAVVGLTLLLLGKWIALREVSPLLLILPPIIGRWSMTLAAYAFPYARASGLGAYYRDGLGRAQVVTASLLTVAAVVLLAAITGDWRTFILLAIGPLVVVIFGRWSARRLGGGLTGDIYGAICELTELVCLLVLTVKLG